MNRTSEIEASMANIAYELENDIYNPPVLKDNKPFNMSDYIKPVRVTDEDFEFEDDSINKIAETIEESFVDKEIDEPMIINSSNDDLSVLTQELIDECYGMEQIAKDDSEKTYTDRVIGRNLDNLKTVVKADNKIEGLKNATQRFKTDNKDIVNNVPEVTEDLTAMAMSKVAPFPNAKKKIGALRKLVDMELKKREQEKQIKMQKQSSTLLGNYFFK
ncbi:MAG: hypothetical protein ACLR0A_18805 [Faecalibacillus intestinalis]